MSTSDKYQGWTNWDTWNANLWLTNDENTYTEATLAASPERVRAVFVDYCTTEDGFIDGINPDKVNWGEIYNWLHEGEED